MFTTTEGPINPTKGASAPSSRTGIGAEDMVDNFTGLVSLPSVCFEIMSLIDSDRSSAQAIGKVISRDPNLTSRLLRLVNSPFFGLAKRVETVSRAISIIGVRELYSLIIGVSAVRSFTSIPSQLVNMDTFWRHSLMCGLIAQLLAKRRHILHPERLFVAGLLHDIGTLVLYTRAPSTARDLLLISGGDEHLFYQAELEVLGFSHAEIAGLLLRKWHLSEELQQAVRWHHDRSRAATVSLETAVVCLANILTERSRIGGFCEYAEEQLSFEPLPAELSGILGAEIDEEEILGEAGLRFADIASVMLPK